MFNSESQAAAIENGVETLSDASESGGVGIGRASADREPAITPLDMRKARFRTAMRGFDRGEVMAFLLEASEGYEQALRDNDRLRQDVARLEASLARYRELEGSIKTTLLTAQKAADDARETAAREAAGIVREAEARAELLIEKAQARVDDVQRHVDTLRMKRREAEVSLESLAASIRNTVALIHEQEQRDMPRAAASHLQVVR